MTRNRVLIIEDEAVIRLAIRRYLMNAGFEVFEADSQRSGLVQMRKERPDAVICDYKLPDANALEILPHLRAVNPSVTVVILTAHASVDLAVSAIQQGADHFLTKPIELPALLVVLNRALEGQRNRQAELAEQARKTRGALDPFAGTSPAIRNLEADVQKILQTDRPILIQGETGTGKGVLATWLHQNGRRQQEPFVDLNCAGLSKDFLESELFGHERGAFTGAVQPKQGLLDLAHRGTLFLDEIGDIDLQVQPKLLKVLEEKRYRRLGDVKDRFSDVRLIAASHHDLAMLVRDKLFRQDLYFRLSTIVIRLPPLHERQEDIPVLANGIIERVSYEMGRPRRDPRRSQHPGPPGVRLARKPAGAEERDRALPPAERGGRDQAVRPPLRARRAVDGLRLLESDPDRGRIAAHRASPGRGGRCDRTGGQTVGRQQEYALLQDPEAPD